MDKSKPYILWFKDVTLKDLKVVGGKNASLGEMFSNLTKQGINIPNGFIITAAAYKYFISASGINEKINLILSQKTTSIEDLQKKGKKVRNLILDETLPNDLQEEIKKAYIKLGKLYFQNPDVAVRSSATAEDLPGASFAGQQETYLNVSGEKELLESVRKCFASLFTNRAISYRENKRFSHKKVAISVGVQKMARSNKSSSGVMFTIDTETGFDKVAVINSSYGLGEMIVGGKVIPDEFIVFKPALEMGYKSIISKTLGDKDRKFVYSTGSRLTKEIAVEQAQRKKFSITDEEALELAKWGIKIEKYFSKIYGKYQPMDIEWAKDGDDKKLYIIQARPETVRSIEDKNVFKEYVLRGKGDVVLTGIAVGTKIATGRVKIVKDVHEISQIKKGQILVTVITNPDWEPIMKTASAIITDKGGRTSHAAIVSRELGIPCIVGTQNATKVLRDGDEITADCSSGENGIAYRGKLSFDVLKHSFEEIPKTKTDIMVNIGNPQEAFKFHYLPARGVGLGRIEFIIASQIKIHPNALINFDHLKKSKDKEHEKVVKNIQNLTSQYSDKKLFYIDKLAEGMGRIAAAFYPYEVLIRFSDFKTNEYRSLIGGDLYEPIESNPMLGLRGASRYYNPLFKEAFGLECKSILKAREEFGLKNIMPMVPFCRTAEEGKRVIEAMKEFGLSRKTSPGIKIYVMCEIPSNVLRADEFLDIFDGFSIGSNDLAQLTLGLDRDSDVISKIGNENDPAVKELISIAIDKCRKRKKYIGICGQGPSDFPQFAQFLVEKKINSISLSPDTVIKTLLTVAEKEKLLS
ncbi:MAG: hypothetical protein ACD_50C00362G0004 [uncultured bacterium]|nr:MAG: hypothetical protein ACD_50C00362G0004 [uncultured bacterium]